VKPGDLDSDGIAVASTSIDLNNGAITDVPGNDAVLTFTPPNTSGVLVDGVAPTITSVTGPAAGTYIVGQHLDFTVVFSEAVAVTGTPRLQLTIGSTNEYATYQSGTGTSTLVFRYTVKSGDLDSDGIAVASPIDLNGGTITDVPGNDAVLTFTPPDTGGVLVDGVAPTITSVTGPAAGTYIVGQHLNFTVVFSEAVAVNTAGGTPRLVLTIGSTTRYATYVSGSGSASLLFRYTVQAGDLDSDGIAVASPIDLNGGTITDVPGNNAVLSFTPPNTSSVLVDGVAPTITNVSGPAAGTYIVGQHLDFTVVFSEAVAVTGTPRLVLTIGSATRYATYVSGSGSASLLFRYTVQAGDEDTDGIAVASPIDLNGGAIKDVPGNDAVLTFTPPDTTTVLVDGVAPTITSVTGPAAGTYIVGQNLDFTVVFSEAVAVTGTPRLVLTIGSTTRYATYVSGSGSASLLFRYTVQAGDYAATGIRLHGPVLVGEGTRIADSSGNMADLTFEETVLELVRIDGITARILSVRRPEEGYRYYGAGRAIVVQVEFDLPVVSVSSGRLSLPIWLDDRLRWADYVSGLGTRQLVFRYVVPAGEPKARQLQPGSELSGQLQSIYGGEVQRALPRVRWTNLLVDGQPPKVLWFLPPTRKLYRPGDWVIFRVVFDENVSLTGRNQPRPQLQFVFRGQRREATYLRGAGTNSLYFGYRLRAGEVWDARAYNFGSFVLVNGSAIRDVAGNAFR
jgi:hypothetical protein